MALLQGGVPHGKRHGIPLTVFDVQARLSDAKRKYAAPAAARPEGEDVDSLLPRTAGGPMWWAALPPMEAKPEVVSLSDVDYSVGDAPRDESGIEWPAAYPMKFAVSVVNKQGQRVHWTLYQGADPYFFVDHLRRRVEREMKPDLVVRINKMATESAMKRKNVEFHYSDHCKRVFYLHGFHAEMLRSYSWHKGHTSVSKALVAHVLAGVHLDLFQALVQEMYQHVPSRRRHGRGVIYLHCHGGMERSRLSFLFLNALFYAAAGLQALPHVPVADNFTHTFGELLLEWEQRQALFKSLHLSLLHLLSTDVSLAPFQLLVHCFARVSGDRARDIFYLRMLHEEGYVPGDTGPSGISLLQARKCAAGAACGRSHGQASSRQPLWMCLHCHDAFFCSIECATLSDHSLRGSKSTSTPCTRCYNPGDAPRTLLPRVHDTPLY